MNRFYSLHADSIFYFLLIATGLFASQILKKKNKLVVKAGFLKIGGTG